MGRRVGSAAAAAERGSRGAPPGARGAGGSARELRAPRKAASQMGSPPGADGERAPREPAHAGVPVLSYVFRNNTVTTFDRVPRRGGV